MANGTAVILVDHQNDFAHCGGALHVKEGETILAAVNALIAEVEACAGLVVTTQDWHPADHVSFAKTHGLPDFALSGGERKWPAHCVAGSLGAEFLSGVNLAQVNRRVLKAFEKDVDSYSGLGGCEFVGGRPTLTLEQVLREQGVETLEVAGLATEYCDRATVMDALRFGFKVRVHRAEVRAVDPAAGELAWVEMAAAGALIVEESCFKEPLLFPLSHGIRS
jgi:nicotinamidase/pyrazinamidase